MTTITTVNSAIERGCGTRAEGGLYACVPTGSTGIPVEAFIIDPPIPWSEGPFRGTRFHRRTNGITDLLLWVGAEYYPSVADFVEEGARHGISKRVPTHRDADYSVLTADSRIVLIHPRAIVRGSYELLPVLEGRTPHIRRPDPESRRDCQHALRRVEDRDIPTLSCTFALWDIAGIAFNCPSHRIVKGSVDEGLTITIQTPSVRYSVMRPVAAKVQYSAGVFMQLPFSHFEYVSSQTNSLPDHINKSVGSNRSRTVITPN